VNFTNRAATYCIEGYKVDNCTRLGLPGWNVTVRNVAGAPVGTAVTNATGWYRVCNLTPGSYDVCEDLKQGWMNVSPVCQNVTVDDTNRTGVNFTNTKLLCVEGYKINTQTGLGLAGWNVTVRTVAGAPVGTAVTNATGWYRVCDLTPGNYNVCEELKAGWVNVSPVCIDIDLSCTNATENINFTNIPLVQTGSISGYKINQSCSCGLTGWTIRLHNATTGDLVTITKTDATGKYSFTGLNFGSYWVNESVQDAWSPVTPAQMQVNISVRHPDAMNINFTNFRSFTCDPNEVVIVNGVEKHVVCIWDP
jgi:uncharacterized surface anchored protein